MEIILWQIGSLIFTSLGVAHLILTFKTDMFSSENEGLVYEMKNSTPKLTRETSMWKAWVGFNASHSAGAIFIGLINCYLAQFYFDQLGHFYFLLVLLTLSFYLWLAKLYWFKKPFTGILLALLLMAIAYTLHLLKTL